LRPARAGCVRAGSPPPDAGARAMTRPGTRLRSLAARLFDTSTMERLIDPAIADLQHEHEDAIRRGLVWRGRWIRLAGYAAFWKVAAMGISRASSRAP